MIIFVPEFTSKKLKRHYSTTMCRFLLAPFENKQIGEKMRNGNTCWIFGNARK
jgi:hypothetical protein